MLVNSLHLVVLAGCTFGGPSGEVAPVEVAESVVYPMFEPGNIVPVVDEATPTAVDVTWTETEATASYVEFGYDTTYGTLAPATADGHAVLLGLKADTEVHARILTVFDDEIFASADFTARTGALPEGLPSVTLDVPAAAGLTDNFGLLTLFNPDTSDSVLLAVDRDGDPVWWEIVPAIFVGASHRTIEGDGILYRTDDPLDLEDANVTVTKFDRSSSIVLPSPGGHHDLVEVAGVGVAVIEEDIREWDGQPVVGDRIVEIRPNGERTIVWSSWDWRDPEWSEAWENNFNPNGADWTHANGIDYDPSSDSYLLSIYSLSTVVRVDRATGETMWELGGSSSDFTFQGDPGFGPQHAPVFAPDGLWIFDNHTHDHDPNTVSRIVRYSLDPEAGTATAAWQWTDLEEPLRTSILGDVRPLPDGNVLASFGTIPRAVVVNPEGAVIWQVHSDRGMMIGRGDMFRSFYGQTEITLP